MATVKTVLPGQPAPEFVLLDQNGLIHTVQSYRGHWLIVFFYPKDNTPACVRESESFRDAMRDFNKRNAKLIGINMDTQTQHAEFAKKYQLDFPLLSDEDGAVCRHFGALLSLGPLKWVRRKTFMVSPAGIVVRIFQRVHIRNHSEQVIQDLDLHQKMVLSKTG